MSTPASASRASSRPARPRRSSRTPGSSTRTYAVVPEPGVLPGPMAEQWVDAQFACTDLVAESTRALTAQTKGRLDTERLLRLHE